LTAVHSARSGDDRVPVRAARRLRAPVRAQRARLPPAERRVVAAPRLPERRPGRADGAQTPGCR